LADALARDSNVRMNVMSTVAQGGTGRISPDTGRISPDTTLAGSAQIPQYGNPQTSTGVSEIILRPYQNHDLETIRSLIRAGRKRILLVQPTGAGKGTLSTFMIRGAVARGKRVIFLVNRRELVRDLSRRLDRLGVDHGIIMADHPRRRPLLSVHIASIDTLHRRDRLPGADLLFADEAHFSLSPIYKKVIDRYPEAVLIGMTATPIAANGRGLGSLYEDIVLGPSVADLTQQGFLVPARVFAPSQPDLTGVGSTAGEFKTKELAEVCDVARLTGDIVEHWKKLASDRKTVLFAVGVKHSQHCAEAFRAAGIDAVHVDANTPDDERDRIWNDLDNGRLPIVCSVGVISYGWDHPIVSAVILARPTRSLGLHLQQCGRGLRPAPGKSALVILDHAANTLRHGFVDDPREWSLADGDKPPRDDFRAPSVRMCKQCWRAYSSSQDACPECGCPHEKRERQIEQVAGNLEEIKREQKLFAIEEWRKRAGDDVKRRKFEEFRRIAAERNYKRGYAPAKFKVLFGYWPPKAWFSGDAPDFSRPEWDAGAEALGAAMESGKRAVKA
jgi:DNA repair protein RadD